MKNIFWIGRWSYQDGRAFRIIFGHRYSMDLFMMWTIPICDSTMNRLEKSVVV